MWTGPEREKAARGNGIVTSPKEIPGDQYC